MSIAKAALLKTKSTTALDDILRVQRDVDLIGKSLPSTVLSGIKIDNSAFSALSKIQSDMSAISRLTYPTKAIGAAASLASMQQNHLFATLHKDVAAFQKRFELPTSKLLAGVQRDLRAVSGLQEVAKRYTLQTRAITDAMKAMHTPWLDAVKQSRSLAGFAALQGIGKTLTSHNGFDVAVSKLIRSDLGDWRDKITWKSIDLTNLHERHALYQDLGFNSDLTEMPDDAFDEAVEIAELDESAPVLIEMFGNPFERLDEDHDGLDRTNFAHRWLFCLESQVRKFIDLNMRNVFGADWPKHQLPNGVFDQWLDRQQKKKLNSGLEHPIIAFSDFSDYERVITKKDNWDQVFRQFFYRQENVRETFQRLHPIRLDTMHARAITKEDVLLLYAETSRLVRVITSFGRVN